jgi:hypothetical protein
MNLKFFDDIYQTIQVMRSGFYYLGLLAGIHTVTFLAYGYLNNLKKGDSKNQEPELPPPLVENQVIEMQDISDLIDKVSINELIDKRKEYKLLLEQKRNELDSLILQLDTVYDNISQIRERLENLNNKSD